MQYVCKRRLAVLITVCNRLTGTMNFAQQRVECNTRLIRCSWQRRSSKQPTYSVLTIAWAVWCAGPCLKHKRRRPGARLQHCKIASVHTGCRPFSSPAKSPAEYRLSAGRHYSPLALRLSGVPGSTPGHAATPDFDQVGCGKHLHGIVNMICEPPSEAASMDRHL